MTPPWWTRWRTTGCGLLHPRRDGCSDRQAERSTRVRVVAQCLGLVAQPLGGVGLSMSVVATGFCAEFGDERVQHRLHVVDRQHPARRLGGADPHAGTRDMLAHGRGRRFRRGDGLGVGDAREGGAQRGDRQQFPAPSSPCADRCACASEAAVPVFRSLPSPLIEELRNGIGDADGDRRLRFDHRLGHQLSPSDRRLHRYRSEPLSAR